MAIPVKVGATVTFHDHMLNRSFKLRIVREATRERAEPKRKKGMMSEDAPISLAIMGREAGETVGVVTPLGYRQITIESVE